MITEDYVSFETAKLLKERGFDEMTELAYGLENGQVRADLPVSYWRNSEIGDYRFSCPTLQMAMKWLREVHKITIGIVFKGDRIYYEIHQNNEFVFGVDTPKSYEEVCDEAIKHCLKNLI